MVIMLLPYTGEYKPLLRQWLDDRELPDMDLDELPEIGVIANCNDKFIAAGFLRRCEGNYAFIDSLVSDPKADKLQRHIALNGIMEKLIETSKDLRIKALLGSTADKNTQERAERLGFKSCPSHTLMTLKLEENQ